MTRNTQSNPIINITNILSRFVCPLNRPMLYSVFPNKVFTFNPTEIAMRWLAKYFSCPTMKAVIANSITFPIRSFIFYLIFISAFYTKLRGASANHNSAMFAFWKAAPPIRMFFSCRERIRIAGLGMSFFELRNRMIAGLKSSFIWIKSLMDAVAKNTTKSSSRPISTSFFFSFYDYFVADNTLFVHTSIIV